MKMSLNQRIILSILTMIVGFVLVWVFSGLYACSVGTVGQSCYITSNEIIAIFLGYFIVIASVGLMWIVLKSNK